jgi:hypothetical protein
MQLLAGRTDLFNRRGFDNVCTSSYGGDTSCSGVFMQNLLSP